MRKILHLTPKYWPHTGGVEKHVALLSSELQRRNYRLVIITDHHSKDLLLKEKIGEETIIRISTNRWGNIPGSGIIRMWFGLIVNIRLILEAELIHCHDFSSLIKWFLPFRLIFPGKPVHVTFHGWEGNFPPRRHIVFARKIVEALARTNLCIGSYITTWYGTRPNAVSHGCVIMPDHFIEKSDRAIFLGRLEPDTGILTYLEALALLAKRGILIPVDVFGDGSLAKQVAEFVSAHGLDITFHGFVSNPEAHLARARYAFVSGYLAILEAMAHRALVFSVYDTPLKHDYLASLPTGTLRIASSAGELAEQLSEAITQSTESQAQIQSAENWARKQSVSALADLYERLWYDETMVSRN